MQSSVESCAERCHFLIEFQAGNKATRVVHTPNKDIAYRYSGLGLTYQSAAMCPRTMDNIVTRSTILSMLVPILVSFPDQIFRARRREVVWARDYTHTCPRYEASDTCVSKQHVYLTSVSQS